MKYFFPDCINEWNNLKVYIRNARLINILTKTDLKYKKNYTFSVFNQFQVNLLTPLTIETSV